MSNFHVIFGFKQLFTIHDYSLVSILID